MSHKPDNKPPEKDNQLPHAPGRGGDKQHPDTPPNS